MYIVTPETKQLRFDFNPKQIKKAARMNISSRIVPTIYTILADESFAINSVWHVNMTTGNDEILGALYQAETFKVKFSNETLDAEKIQFFFKDTLAKIEIDLHTCKDHLPLEVLNRFNIQATTDSLIKQLKDGGYY